MLLSLRKNGLEESRLLNLWRLRSSSEARASDSGEIKISTSTVAALFSKMALTGQRIAIVDMVSLVFFFQNFHTYRRGGWNQSFTLKIFFSCSLGGGGRYFSVPCLGLGQRLRGGAKRIA